MRSLSPRSLRRIYLGSFAILLGWACLRRMQLRKPGLPPQAFLQEDLPVSPLAQAPAQQSSGLSRAELQHAVQAASAHQQTKERRFSFLDFLGGMGVLLLLILIGDLTFRGFTREVPPPIWEQTEAQTDPGRRAIVKYGCGGCHVIPGIRHATGRVGPRLDDFRHQMYIGGVLANVPENLSRWIQNPQEFSPNTAMPNLQVTPEEAQAMAAYLYANP